MKAISVTHHTDSGFPCISLYADSAIWRDKDPVFVPDIEVDWHLRISLAVRIGRLGKHIDQKYAMRYVDAVSMVGLLEPAADTALGQELIRSGYTAMIDFMVTTGRWADIPADGLDSIKIEVCGEALQVGEITPMVASSISRVSALSTLKTGDIIILPHVSVLQSIEDNQRVTATIDSCDCLNIKIKC